MIVFMLVDLQRFSFVELFQQRRQHSYRHAIAQPENESASSSDRSSNQSSQGTGHTY